MLIPDLSITKTPKKSINPPNAWILFMCRVDSMLHPDTPFFVFGSNKISKAKDVIPIRRVSTLKGFDWTPFGNFRRSSAFGFVVCLFLGCGCRRPTAENSRHPPPSN